MNIQLKLLDKNSADIKKMKQLYITAFPANERAPFFLLKSKAKKDNIDFLGIYNNGKWAGFFYIVSLHDLSYVFYFAVDSEQRGMGIGSEAIKDLIARYSANRLFLAIEEVVETAPNYEERVKRKDFYMKNGFEPLGKKLIEGEVTYDVLGVNGTVSPEEYDKLIESFSGKLLKKIFTMKIVE